MTAASHSDAIVESTSPCNRNLLSNILGFATLVLVILSFHPAGPVMKFGSRRSRGSDEESGSSVASPPPSSPPPSVAVAALLNLDEPTTTTTTSFPPQSSSVVVVVPEGSWLTLGKGGERATPPLRHGEGRGCALGPLDMASRFKWNVTSQQWEFPPSSPDSIFYAESPSTEERRTSDIGEGVRRHANDQLTNSSSSGKFSGRVRSDSKDANPCGWRRYSPRDIMTSFKNTTILFVGDSTVRNIAMAIIASVCNPAHWQDCTQRNHWPFQDPDIWHATNCRNESASNWCQDPNKLSIQKVPLPGLTTEEFYMTRLERRTWWKKGLVPPLLVAEFGEGTRIMTLEASCVNSKHKKQGSDGLDRMFQYLSDASNRRENPLLDSIDIVVTGGGLHCDMVDFKVKPPWYVRLALAAKPLVHRFPVIWLEPTNCAKMGGGRSTVNCPYFISRAPTFLKHFTAAGMTISPGNFMTPLMGTNFTFILPMEPLSPNTTEAQEPCPFVDPLHVCLRCYGDMAQVHYNTIMWTLSHGRPPRRRGGKRVKSSNLQQRKSKPN